MIYRHKKTGNLYEIITTANSLATGKKKRDYPEMVVYKPLNDGSVWAKPSAEFYRDFELILSKMETT